jgi:trans-cinnamate 4-monooxygenase
MVGVSFLCVCRKLASTKAMDNNGLKCAIDHILEAQQKGEINEDNVLYIVENINVAGTRASVQFTVSSSSF